MRLHLLAVWRSGSPQDQGGPKAVLRDAPATALSRFFRRKARWFHGGALAPTPLALTLGPASPGTPACAARLASGRRCAWRRADRRGSSSGSSSSSHWRPGFLAGHFGPGSRSWSHSSSCPCCCCCCSLRCLAFACLRALQGPSGVRCLPSQSFFLRPRAEQHQGLKLSLFLFRAFLGPGQSLGHGSLYRAWRLRILRRGDTFLGRHSCKLNCQLFCTVSRRSNARRFGEGGLSQPGRGPRGTASSCQGLVAKGTRSHKRERERGVRMASSWKEEVLERSRGDKGDAPGQDQEDMGRATGGASPELPRRRTGACLACLIAGLLLLLLLLPSPPCACTSESHMTPDASEDVTDHKPEQLCQQL